MAQEFGKSYAIFLNGEYPPKEGTFYRELISNVATTIAVDGGWALFERLGLIPDTILADFDSSAPPEQNKEIIAEIITLDPDKDKTDGELALELALNRGAGEIVICGYRGGPATDQILGNLLLLQKAADTNPTANVYCLSATERIWFVRDRTLELSGTVGDNLSVVALDNQIRLSITGVRYSVDNLIINRGETTAHSNTLLLSVCQITIDGAALVFLRRNVVLD